MNCFKTISIALCFTVFLTVQSFAAVNVGSLRCEHLENPQGIDVTAPRLSWQLASSERGVKQSAYQVTVATSEANLKSGAADLWDSGKVSSDQSILVPYAGKPLNARTDYFWRVRVWDAEGKASEWSETAKWSMGILDPKAWNAKWIGLDGYDPATLFTGTSWIWFPEGNPQVDAAGQTSYFRRVITLPADKKIKRALFEYTGDNECQGWIDAFDLGEQKNFKTVKMNDITKRLEPGKTYVLGLLGRNVTGVKPNPGGVIGKLTVEFADGEMLDIQTDEQWKASKDLVANWNTSGFDDSKWVAAKKMGPAEMKPWGAPRTGPPRRLPARYLRKDFSVAKEIARATVSFSGLGSSELFVNGKKVGDAVLSPALAQYNKRAFYVTHDVTNHLQRGENALGVILGNGRYYTLRPAGMVDFGFPKLLLNLRIEYADGTVKEIVSDESWQLTTDGPIQANNEFDGEEYDARKELNGWSEPGYTTRPLPAQGQGSPVWASASMVDAPGEVLAAEMQRPIRVTGTLKPISVKEINPGVFIYDMGQNMVGWTRLHVSGDAGTSVTLRYAETLKPDGSLYRANLRGAKSTDLYTLKGGGKETWEARFVTHGFRFVEVTGFPGKPDLNSLEGRVVNDDLPTAGEFQCSNDLINRIYGNIVWGVRGNNRSMPMDCPQRDERMAWLGDRSEGSKGEAYIFDISTLYTKWRQDIADAQRPTGSIPDVAPAYWQIYSDGVTWPSTAIIIPSTLERHFGDTSTIGKHYDGAKRWMEYMLKFAKDNLISKDQYGDWCVPPEEPHLIHSKDPARQTDKTLLATSYFYQNLCLMEKYALSLGKAEDAARWKTLAANFKKAFNEKFLDREKGQYSNGTQTSSVLPLAFGLVPEDMKTKVFASLVNNIENVTKGHIGTGLIGGQYLNRVLSDNGRADLSYTIAGQKDYPSWGYMVENGATTLWELWNGNTANPAMNSQNHVMLAGDLVVWFYEYLAGIAPASPGFKTIKMEPHPVGDLKFVKAWHNSPYGKISSEWKKDGDQFDWQIEIPANTTATVYVPATNLENVRVEGASTERFENGRAIFELGSGKYHFVSESQPQTSTSSTPPQSSKRYDIAAFVWPSYHPDDRAKIFWPDGIGEWQTVKNAKPRFEGHDQPRVPLWGYVNEADPKVMEMQIAAAADHGVNVFIYDWYWYDRMPFLEACLNDGFLKAANNSRMKFYLMWANHDVGVGWDKRNADDGFSGKNKSLIWKGAVDRKEFEIIAQRWIKKYFSQPTYYKIDGKPVFMLYDLDVFVKGLGGIDQAKDAIEWFRAEVKQAGFPGLELQLSLRKDSKKSQSAVASDNIGTQKEAVVALGFDSLTHYHFCHFTDVNNGYNAIMKNVVREWETISTNYTAKYYPHISVGWDASPRAFNYTGPIVKNNTPANVEQAFRQAKAFVDAHPQQAPLITVNSWNEWTETSYLQPDTKYGFGYLEAIKKVFLEDSK